MANDLNANEEESKKAWPFIAVYVLIVFGLFGAFVGIVLLMTGILRV